RISGALAGRANQGACRARSALRGVRRERALSGPLPASAGANGRPDRIIARTLSPKGLRHRRCGGEGIAADPRPHGRKLRFDLLRHGRIVRLRGRALRDVAEDRRARRVAEDPRNGTRLLRAAEDYAVERGCFASTLETHSYQARPFYEKCGYQVFGTLEDHPPGHAKYFMRKQLAEPPDQAVRLIKL